MKSILEYTSSATRLIDFFYNSFITRINNVIKDEKFDIIFIGSNDLNNCDSILEYTKSDTTYYIDSVTESSGFYGVYENVLQFKKKY